MTSTMYPKWMESAAKADANTAINSATAATAPTCVLLKNSYTYNAGHQFVSDWTAGNIATSRVQITSPTVGVVAPGVFNGAAVSFVGVPTATINAIGIYVNNSGTDGSSRLFVYIDTPAPVSANGGDITVTWNASGIVDMTNP